MLQIVIEIVINLIGAEIFAVYLLDEKHPGPARWRRPRALTRDGVPERARSAQGTIGKAVALDARRPAGTRRARTTCASRSSASRCAIKERPIGAIAIYSLLQQKNGFTALDHELFTLLGGHAATAIFAARLYSQSERKLNTIQGFIDLLTK